MSSFFVFLCIAGRRLWLPRPSFQTPLYPLGGLFPTPLYPLHPCRRASMQAWIPAFAGMTGGAATAFCRAQQRGVGMTTGAGHHFMQAL